MQAQTADTPGPKNLKEVMEGDQSGWRLAKTYWVELTHGLMGFFPAVFKGTDEPVITTDLEVLKRVWAMLTPRKAKITEQFDYVNESLEISVRLPVYRGESLERCVVGPILTMAKLESLIVNDMQPFEWALGLVGPGMTREEFIRTIEIAFEQHQRD